MPTVSPSVAQELAQLKKRILELENARATVAAPQSNATLPDKSTLFWLTNLLQGVTLASIVGCAFWLGELSSTVFITSTKVDKLTDSVDKLTDSVAGASKESLSSRISVIETKLDALDRKLNSK